MKTQLLILFTSASVALATVPPTDAEIELAIEKSLLRDPAVPASRLHVAVEQGVVTLTGSVSDILAWQRATRIARQTLGVRSVVDRSQVLAPPVPDDRLIARVQQALRDEPAVENFELHVGADNGVVTLTGEVDSWQELRSAERAVKNVTGVRRVSNQVQIRIREQRSDQDIRADVLQRLRYDLRVRENRIRVTVADGKVKLSGEVGSPAERQRAYTLAFVANIRSVDASKLRVNSLLPSHSYKKRLDGTEIADAGITDALRLALKLDPRVRGEVKVRARKGHVTLDGWVATAAGKNAASRDALMTHGVRRVTNQLQVKPAVVRNLELRVRDLLQRDAILGDSDIAASVIGDKVYLNGAVETFYQRSRAGRLVANLAGVGELENRLRIEPPVEAELPPGVNYDGNHFKLHLPHAELAHELKHDVLALLAAHPEIEAGEVHVDVRRQSVTLTGTVDSWRLRRLAEQVAKSAGARRVINSLIVDESFRTE